MISYMIVPTHAKLGPDHSTFRIGAFEPAEFADPELPGEQVAGAVDVVGDIGHLEMLAVQDAGGRIERGSGSVEHIGDVMSLVRSHRDSRYYLEIELQPGDRRPG